MSIDDDAALGDGSEEIVFVQEATIMKVEEFESLEEEGIQTHLRGCFELYLLKQLCFEPRMGRLVR